ncbi:hypothetical protein [Halosimplex pelagicum]|uniref:DUF1059 domain-containing protein n=1 Tax=Halosimplex pelagicum TaxID=869886 RepID=A0A7D5TTS5_9EURY|nr:hypothetical protein [Halosimplex pelagicum]QLH81714.1 hypothetical protein HZS54_08780 [Halosimplex pelagicum]
MARFSVDCETCSFTAEAPTVAAALSAERAHRREQGVEHRVTIERRPRDRERPLVTGSADGRPPSDRR